ncbi:MAG: sigma-70 family RNA polymerase sigma factor [Flavobacteriaceae bacterium]|nr:sigma-70 family RNA polymerase sigma factor [Flavobacteriaceae bacterium]
MAKLTDEDYIDKTLKGDANAFAFLIDKYKDMVFTLAVKMVKSREEAEEVSQDTFIKAYKFLPKFKGDSKFSTWLYKIGYNTSLDAIKKKTNQYNAVAIDEITVNYIASVETILDGIERNERAIIINQCLEQLPEDEKAILVFFYFKELSLKEIIEVTSMSEANVKVKLHRARKKLLSIVKNTVEPELISHYGRK